MTSAEGRGATQRWRLEVLWAVPRGLNDARLERMAAEAEAASGWYVTRTRAGLSVAARVTAVRPDRELGLLVGRSADWVGGHVPDPRLVALRARTDDEAAAELGRPDVPPLAGVGDAAQILGVTRERVQRWRVERRDFPAPVARLVGGPLWTVEALRHFRRRIEDDRHGR